MSVVEKSINHTPAAAAAIHGAREKITGKCLKDAGVTNGYDSTTESALGKLFYLLGQFTDPAAVKS